MTAKTRNKVRKREATGEHVSLFSDFDIGLFREGRHFMLYKHMGAHVVASEHHTGVQFSVWAPGADYVSVIGDFNNWSKASHPMAPRWDGSGIWELFVPGLSPDTLYKFHIGNAGFTADKADPFGFAMEMPPHTASRIVAPDTFPWRDEEWMVEKTQKHITRVPLSIYEVHLGSWRRVPEEGNRWLTYRELAAWLPQYCNDLGFTHVELLPTTEHPFYGSWGYQVSGYFAPTSRLGSPDDFRFLVDTLHRHHIGVILDWVPSHFPGDAHGLYFFDGSHLYEHADPKEGYHPDWKSYIFNYGRNEVRSFLISNAIFWLDQYHIDGLRVDAVASMLYRDYSRKEGEWIPNHMGGRENLEAIDFLRQLNEAIHSLQPGAFTIAEESTAFPGVTHAVQEGGLGFDLKWMMGWMHDTLAYFKTDPLYRSFHQHQLTFSLHYAWSEHFVLPLSHDEVVHGKGSLIRKMPGDEWQQAANLRLLYGYMFGHPGAKLLFMGGEWAQPGEWQHDYSLDWHLSDQPFSAGIRRLVSRLNELYRSEPALYINNYSPESFEWIDFSDTQNSVLCWLRKGPDASDQLLFVAHATPRVLQRYRLGVPDMASWEVVLQTDDALFGGSNTINEQVISSQSKPWHGRPLSIEINLAPLSVIILKPVKHYSPSIDLKEQHTPLK